MAHFFMARFGRDLPAYDLPAGVTIRTFAPGDEETFLRCCAGGELGTESWSLDDVREKLLGKPVGSDKESGKYTYAAVVGLDKARSEAAKLTEEAVRALSAFGDREFLEGLTRLLLERNY